MYTYMSIYTLREKKIKESDVIAKIKYKKIK